MKHLEIQNILFPLQHGFRRNHSCESQLLSLFQDLASSTTQTDILIMSFSKAFDKVLHKPLNYKLNWYGSRGMHLSGSLTFSLLDPKGLSWTVLPLTVLRYCPGTHTFPDLHQWPPWWDRKQYSALICWWLYYLPSHQKQKRHWTSPVWPWFCRLLGKRLNWLMQFNADKCFTMMAGRSKTIINKSYKLHDHPLQSTDSVKYLGFTLTSDLKAANFGFTSALK